MEKGEEADFASTNCSLRTFFNQKTFTIRWNIENCLEMFCTKPAVEKQISSFGGGTCLLKTSEKEMTFDIRFAFSFYCKVIFRNATKKFFCKRSGKSFRLISIPPDSSPEQFFRISVLFEELKILPNDGLLIVCTVAKNEAITSSFTQNPLSYLQQLGDIIKKLPPTYIHEKVTIRWYDFTESVNKAVLCGNSPVLTDILQTENIVDIEFPVLKPMVAFLNSGILRCEEFNSVCFLYRIANKYDIRKLHDTCSAFLVFNLNVQNVCEVLILSSDQNDIQLKKNALSFFKYNWENVLLTDQWGVLMRYKVELGLEAIAVCSQLEKE